VGGGPRPGPYVQRLQARLHEAAQKQAVHFERDRYGLVLREPIPFVFADLIEPPLDVASILRSLTLTVAAISRRSQARFRR
jgi:hypothetical protein